MSIAADVARTIYRHKESGLLVDPGGWWLKVPIEKVLADLDRAKWLKENCTKLGRMTVDEFKTHWRRLVPEIKSRTGAKLMVFNVMVIDPGSRQSNYQLVNDPASLRRREFNVALFDLSRELDFSVIDIDRVLKNASVLETQMDFSHYPPEMYGPVGREIESMLSDLKVFARQPTPA